LAREIGNYLINLLRILRIGVTEALIYIESDSHDEFQWRSPGRISVPPELDFAILAGDIHNGTKGTELAS
jgi:hypothetical protein